MGNTRYTLRKGFVFFVLGAVVAAGASYAQVRPLRGGQPAAARGTARGAAANAADADGTVKIERCPAPGTAAMIRTPDVSMAASTVSRYAEVRKEMVRIQQQLAAETDMLVDGRDICTTVLPNATAKIFLTAAQEERARRRYLELKEKGMDEPYEKVLEDLKARDEQDMNRPVEPLRQAPDAELVDSTSLTFDETVEAIVRIVEAKRRG